MNSARDRKIRANNKVEQLIKDVFIKRPITNLVETSYGFRACFGLKKDGTPDKRRLGKDRALAKEIKEQWNRALAKGDQTTANAITTLTAINTAKAVELMRETPFEILDAVEFFLEHGMPPTVITVAEAMDITEKHFLAMIGLSEAKVWDEIIKTYVPFSLLSADYSTNLTR